MGLPDLHHFSRQHCNVLVGGFLRNVRLDLAVYLDVLHLRINVTVQRIPRALRQSASLRRGKTSLCC